MSYLNSYQKGAIYYQKHKLFYITFQNCFEGEYAFVSNETEQYDFFILDYHHTTPDVWIIQDADGSIRVWDTDFPGNCNELFFGKEDSYICEKVGEDKYIEVTV